MSPYSLSASLQTLNNPIPSELNNFPINIPSPSENPASPTTTTPEETPSTEEEEAPTSPNPTPEKQPPPQQPLLTPIALAKNYAKDFDTNYFTDISRGNESTTKNIINLLEQKKYEEGLEALMALLKDDPDNPKYNHLAGLTYFQQQQYTLAIPYLEQIPIAYFYAEDATWILALAHVLTADLEKARLILAKDFLPFEGNDYEVVAKRLAQAIDKIVSEGSQ